jgi:hypothetical protein
LREEYGLRGCEKRVLRNIFGPKRGGYKMRVGTLHVAHMMEKRKSYMVLIGKLVGNRQFGRHRNNEMIILKWFLRNRMECFEMD